MTKYYEVEVTVRHVVEVEADSEEEAMELAYDEFLDQQDMWDDVDTDIVYEEDV